MARLLLCFGVFAIVCVTAAEPVKKLDSLVTSSNGSQFRSLGNISGSDAHSQSHLEQCRASCLEKYLSKARLEYLASTTRSHLVAGQLRRLPNLLRLRRKREIRNKHPPTRCLKSSPECLSCWNSCQESHENKGTNTFPANTNTNNRTAASASSQADSIPELRLVLLMNEGPLIIAKLRWNAVAESDAEPQYLITWELSGGGLKGHLVTASNSANLSLWPNTTYKVTLALLDKNLSPDEELAAAEDDNVSPKSLPLRIDTSAASVQLYAPIAQFLRQSDATQYLDDDEDLSAEDRETSNPISVGQVLCVIFVSLALVFLIFTMIVGVWIALRRALCIQNCFRSESESACFFCCAGDDDDIEKNDRLLEVLQEESQNSSIYFSSSHTANTDCTFSQSGENLKSIPLEQSTLAVSLFGGESAPQNYFCDSGYFGCGAGSATPFSTSNLPISTSPKHGYRFE